MSDREQALLRLVASMEKVNSAIDAAKQELQRIIDAAELYKADANELRKLLSERENTNKQGALSDNRGSKKVNGYTATG